MMGASASSSSSDAQEWKWFPSCSPGLDPTCDICAPKPPCLTQRGVGSATATPLETRLSGGPLGRAGSPLGPVRFTQRNIGSQQRLKRDRVNDSVLHSFTDEVAAAPKTPRTRAADKNTRGDFGTILALPCANGEQSDPDFLYTSCS